METLSIRRYILVQVANIVPVVALKVLGAEKPFNPEQSWIFFFVTHHTGTRVNKLKFDE